MPMIAKQNQYTLLIVEDNDAQSPRDDNPHGGDRDNFGTMICFHKRYNLGEEHNYNEPAEFLSRLVMDNVPAGEVIEYVKSNKFDTLRLEYNKQEKHWEISVYNNYFKKWHTEKIFEAPLASNDEVYVSEIITEYMQDKDLLELAEKYAVVIPLYLYGHSGITMNTVGFSCPWDSGQVGWIYASYDDIKKEYGKVTPETLSRAEDLLEAEVKEYDYYLTDQCYGFKLFEGENEIESCWGFLGSMSEVSEHIKEYLPDECKDMVNTLEYHAEELSEEKYLEYENEELLEI